MAVATDGRFALLHSKPATLTGRENLRVIKFCNGELMGKKLKFTKFQLRTNVVKPNICMSLTADVAGEAKLKDLEPKKEDARTVVAIILGGGAGTRLFPLTKRRAKPAVPIGGAYRLIDVPMSNCINSGINKVYILTQFNSASLNRHISRAYNFGNGVTFGDGYVEVLAATQTPGELGKRWFQGTADAVRQFHWLFEIVDSIVSHGSFLTNCFVEHSVVGIRSRIGTNVHLKDTVMLGADYYETDAEIASQLAEGKVPLGIGENTRIKDCIIDKNARIGKNVVIANSEGIQEADRSSEGFYIRSGITVISKNSTIPDGTVI